MSSQSGRLLADFPPVDYARWRQLVERELQGADFEKRLSSRTPEGIAIQPLYTREHAGASADDFGVPGAPPYARGDGPLGRSRERWDMRQEVCDPDVSQAAARIAADLERRGGSVWVTLARALRLGRDPEQAAQDADVADGVACGSAGDLAQVLHAVPLDKTHVFIDAGANAVLAASWLGAVAKQRGTELRALHGHLLGDPLGALARDGRLPAALPRMYDELAELTRWTQHAAPGLGVIGISTAAYHDAGAHAVHEVAYALATGLDYLRAMEARELTVDQVAPQLLFSFSIGTDFFMEVAKLRAARLCWAKVVSACGGGAAAQAMRMHARTSRRSLTQRDPWVNLLRTTTESFAAALGGADSIATLPFDAILGGSELGSRLAANIQVILDEESHVAQVADAAGGSWYLESLTRELARAAWQTMQTLEAKGGMEQALREGEVQRQLDEVAEARAKDIATRKVAITGVSEFPKVDEEPLPRPSPDWKALRAATAERLRAGQARARGQGKDAATLLQALESAPEASRVPAAIAAAEAGAAVTPLLQAYRRQGNDSPGIALEALPVRRTAAAYERLRDASDAMLAARGTRPRAFLCNMGSIPEHKARAAFVTNLLGAGGFEVLQNDGFADPATAAEAFVKSGAPVAVICSTDARYAEVVPPLASSLRESGAKAIVLAGKPAAAQEASYRTSGVDSFVYMGCDVLLALRTLLERAGVSLEV